MKTIDTQFDEIVAHVAAGHFSQAEGFDQARRIARQLERENARMNHGLDLIRRNGGRTTDEGLSCNGSWCAEQARATLQVP